MDVSITAVTANRRFSKSLSRHWQALSGLRGSLLEVELQKPRIETLQIVFMDRSLEHVRVVGGLQKLTQVEVGIPEDVDLYCDDQDKFLDFVRSSVLRAVSELLIPSTDRELMLAKVKGHS